jgi:hypothetical protein
MSEIFDNAVDSLRIAIEYFLRERGYSSRKHAILTLFHAIELFLKEQLARTNPILIYRKIDVPITDDSQTVGIKEALIRLENLKQGLGKEPTAAIEQLQKRRNRIEHHRYDEQEADEKIISEAINFILFFVEGVLEANLEESIPPEILRSIQDLVFERQDRHWIATYRFERWMAKQWPGFDFEVQDSPDEFEGTERCPLCNQEFLVFGYHARPFCFHCNTSVDAWQCEHCGCTHISEISRCPSEEEDGSQSADAG